MQCDNLRMFEVLDHLLAWEWTCVAQCHVEELGNACWVDILQVLGAGALSLCLIMSSGDVQPGDSQCEVSRSNLKPTSLQPRWKKDGGLEVMRTFY